MTNSFSILVASPRILAGAGALAGLVHGTSALAHDTLAPASASVAWPVPLPLYNAVPELAAATMVALAALAMALLLQRRAQAAEERSRHLEQQLQGARKAHADLESALAGSHEVLCRLAHGQENVREAERSRIAGALHAELGHRLLSLRVELALQQAAVRGTSPCVHDKLSTAIANLDAVIKSTRAIVAGLRPIAAGTSLRQAMHRHLTQFAHLHGLDFRFDAGTVPDGQCRHERESDTLLLRALQEALAEIARHAQANAVGVTLIEAAADITLKIEDDGVDLLARPAPGSSTGGAFDCIREHLEALGGRVQLAARRRGGAVLTISLPLPQPAAATSAMRKFAVNQ